MRPVAGTGGPWAESLVPAPLHRWLTFLNLAHMKLVGSLPESWGADGAFPALQHLYLNNMKLTGTLPVLWGRTSFRSLQWL